MTYEEKFVEWWRETATQPGTRFVDLLTWSMVMSERQQGLPKRRPRPHTVRRQQQAAIGVKNA